MTVSDGPAETPDTEAVERALAREGIHRAYAAEVQAMYRSPRGRWRPCCGLLCDPCVLDLGRVVEALRRDAARGERDG
jgi:hypothetical protein